MKIAVGADHGGYEFKTKLISFLEKQGHAVADLGTHSAQSCDYPLISYKVAQSVAAGIFDQGILVCKSGIGMSIVANKVPGVRAALCLTESLARSSREHNNANVLVLAGSAVNPKQNLKIVKAYLKTKFAAGRHNRRVKQIGNIERKIKNADCSGS